MRRFAIVLALVACEVACEEPEAPMARVPAPLPVDEAIDDAEDELPEPPSSAWPTEVESLREALDAFQSEEACVAELRARTPTLLAEGIADLAYDGFFDDVCAGLAAVKSGSVEACDALPISTARAGCRRRLAIVHGEPSACPADRVVPGREAVCVAWAARDPGLCRASSEPERCRAVLSGDEDACARLRAGDRERCRAEIRRYAPSLGDERADSPATREPAVLTLEVREGDREPFTITRDVLDRGVRVVERACRWEIELEAPLGDPPLPFGPGRGDPTFRLELAIPTRDAAPITIPLGSEAVLSLWTPAQGRVTSIIWVAPPPDGRPRPSAASPLQAVGQPSVGSATIGASSGTVMVDRLELRRGGAIAGTVNGTLRAGGAELRVEGRFASFVRDLDPLPSHCVEAASAARGG